VNPVYNCTILVCGCHWNSEDSELQIKGNLFQTCRRNCDIGLRHSYTSIIALYLSPATKLSLPVQCSHNPTVIEQLCIFGPRYTVHCAIVIVLMYLLPTGIAQRSEVDVFSSICLFVNTITSERLNVGWWNLHCTKLSPEFKFGGHRPNPWVPTPENVAVCWVTMQKINKWMWAW